jgi:tetratricopeptide (TPR) repeat protein
MLKRLKAKSKRSSLAKENRVIVELVRQGDLSKAFATANRLLKEHGADPLILYSRGSTHMANAIKHSGPPQVDRDIYGEAMDSAIAEFSEAIELCKGEFSGELATLCDSYISRGAAHKLLKDFRKADKDYDKALELCQDKANEKALALGSSPRFGTVLLNRAQLFDAMHLPQEAVAAYSEFIKTQRNSELLPVALNNRALALQKLDNEQSLALAADDLNSALSLAPDNRLYHQNYAVVLAKMGDKEGALREHRLAGGAGWTGPPLANADESSSEVAPRARHSEKDDAPLLTEKKKKKTAKKKKKKAQRHQRASANDTTTATPSSSSSSSEN